MLKSRCAALLCVALAGCAHVRVEQLYANRYLVQCAGAARCYRAAAKTCGGPFDVVNSGTETTGASRVGNDAYVYNRTTLVVQCSPERAAR